MFCKHCGKQISDDARFCESCGERVFDTPAVNNHIAPEKKPAKKKKSGCLGIALIFFVLLLGSCGAILGDTEENTSETVPYTTEAVLIEETDPIVTVATESPSIDKSAILEVAVSYIKQLMSESFEGYEVSYDDTGITINIWQDGIAAGATFADSVKGEYLQSWNTMVDNFVSMAESTRTYLDTLGLNDIVLSINILNDQNKENILVMIVNDILVFDVVNDE